MIKIELSMTDILSILNHSVLNFRYFDINFEYVCTLDNIHHNSIIFAKDNNETLINNVSLFNNILIVSEYDLPNPICFIKVANTRLAMGKVLQHINQKQYQFSIDSSKTNNLISPNSKIGKNVLFESNIFIDEKVDIGDNCIIRHGSIILRNTVIGRNSIVRENSVIGGQGFAVEKDENNNNFKIPHHGGVIIGDCVEIGALNTIVSGTINPTIISDYTKIDDHVHIAHNCKIGRNCIITAGVILSGSVSIGDNVWIGPNSSVKNSISIANNTLIGIGTLVSKNIVNENCTFAGNPAKDFTKFIEDKKAIDYLINNIDKIKEILIRGNNI